MVVLLPMTGAALLSALDGVGDTTRGSGGEVQWGSGGPLLWDNGVPELVSPILSPSGEGDGQWEVGVQAPEVELAGMPRLEGTRLLVFSRNSSADCQRLVVLLSRTGVTSLSALDGVGDTT
jgi:hypothetical protein